MKPNIAAFIMASALALTAPILLSGCGKKELESGQVSERGGVVYRSGKNKPFTGTVVFRNGDRNINRRTAYKKGLPDGLTEHYSEVGVLYHKERFRAGKLHGKSERFHGPGKELESVAVYNDGKPDGEFFTYDIKGNVTRYARYRNGVAEGEHFARGSDGSLKLDLHQNGEEVASEIYRVDGSPESFKYWRRKEPSCVRIDSFDKNGNLSSRSHQAMRIYEDLTYYPSGALKSREIRRSIYGDAYREEYDESGKLTRKKDSSEWRDLQKRLTSDMLNPQTADSTYFPFRTSKTPKRLFERTAPPPRPATPEVLSPPMIEEEKAPVPAAAMEPRRDAAAGSGNIFNPPANLSRAELSEFRKCGMALMKLFMNIKIYSSNHGGGYPPTLEGVDRDDDGALVSCCGRPFVYLPVFARIADGLDPAKLPLVFTPPGRHPANLVNVCFYDGHLETLQLNNVYKEPQDVITALKERGHLTTELAERYRALLNSSASKQTTASVVTPELIEDLGVLIDSKPTAREKQALKLASVDENYYSFTPYKPLPGGFEYHLSIASDGGVNSVSATITCDDQSGKDHCRNCRTIQQTASVIKQWAERKKMSIYQSKYPKGNIVNGVAPGNRYTFSCNLWHNRIEIHFASNRGVY